MQPAGVGCDGSSSGSPYRAELLIMAMRIGKEVWQSTILKRCQACLSWMAAARPQYQTSTTLFLRLLGAVYCIAFVSLGAQASGLIGRHGILPAAYYLQIAHQQLGMRAYYLIPTLAWFNSGDLMWPGLCIAGFLLSLLALVGYFSAPLLFLMWTFYLSLMSVGRDFLGFQWDALLLEAGFLAIFLAPLQAMPQRGGIAPPRLVLWLEWWLVFRLMLSSGLVKLLSGDPTWANLTALNYHYETQPLPNPISWYMHQLPERFQKTSVGVTFVLELALPFFILLSRPTRQIACFGLIILQFCIMATGNYAFFNWLTIALCIPLLDEWIWAKLRIFKENSSRIAVRKWPEWIIVPISVLLFIVSSVVFTSTLGLPIPWPSGIDRLAAWTAPFCVANRYGLFAVMTTERPEIVLEGSDDGQRWKEYEFRYKPGDLSRCPAFVAPHQPRLDWQMWFAALGNYTENPWYGSLCKRLLEGRSEVLGLLQNNPFPSKPPRFIRGVLYQYNFTNLEQRRTTGHWWRRESKGLYSPVMSLHPESDSLGFSP